MYLYIIIFLQLAIIISLAYLYCQQKSYAQKMNTQHNSKLFDNLSTLENKLTLFEVNNNTKLQSLYAEQIKLLQDLMNNGLQHMQNQLNHTFNQQHARINDSIQGLNKTTEDKLNYIANQVDNRLQKSFKNTNEIFLNVVNRLSIIDQAQKKITDLSHNILDLQDILSNKNTRGLFGEMQLTTIISNILPQKFYAFQESLSNGKRADCIISLPAPNGKIVIDAKFPLDDFKKYQNSTISHADKKIFLKRMINNIKKYIDEIAEKYILVPETVNNAIMFLSAENVFAHLHNFHNEVIEYAYQKNVWIASPTTLMALLSMINIALKNMSTMQHINIIRQQIQELSAEFQIFWKNMEKLEKHINLAHKDIGILQNTAKKINRNFNCLDNAEINDLQVYATTESEKKY